MYVYQIAKKLFSSRLEQYFVVGLAVFFFFFFFRGASVMLGGVLSYIGYLGTCMCG